MKLSQQLRFARQCVFCMISLCAGFSLSSVAATITVTFDPFPIPFQTITSYTEAGVTFYATGVSYCKHAGPGISFLPDNGTGHLLFGAAANDWLIEKRGTVFSAKSVDLSEYSTVYARPKQITFVGHKPDSTTVSTVFTTDGMMDGEGGSADFQTFKFPDSFTGLVSLESPNNLYAMDNLTLEANGALMLQTQGSPAEYGTPSPFGYGTALVTAGTRVKNSVSGIVDDGNGTRRLCTGWTGTGNIYSCGTGTVVFATITTNSTVTWNWRKQYRLTVSSNGAGTVAAVDEWQDSGTHVVLTASAAAGWVFSSWEGDTGGCEVAGCTLTAPMTEPRTITAEFVLAPAGQDSGLVLWNRLGSDEETLHSAVGSGGLDYAGSFVPGVFGRALQLSNTSKQTVVSFPASAIPKKAGCLEFWARVRNLPESLPWGESLALIGAPYDNGNGSFISFLRFNGNDGVGNGGLCGGFWGYGACGTGMYGDWTHTSALKGASVTNWHHYALVWDYDGITGVGSTAKPIAIYVDGELNTACWGALNNPRDAEILLPSSERFGLLYFYSSVTANAAVDNLKIWSYAKTDFSDRFVEASGYTETVAFDPNGGSVDPASRSVSAGGGYGPLPVPTREGYTFGNWTMSTGGVSFAVTADTVVSVATNHTLTASWTANTYTVSLDANGGAVSPDSLEVTFDSAYVGLPVPEPPESPRLPYVFGGWFTDGGEAVEAGTTVTTAADHTLYALWLETPYIADPSEDDALTSAGSFDGYFYGAEDVGGTSCTVVRGSLFLNMATATGRLTAKATTQSGALAFSSAAWDSVGEDGTFNVTMVRKGGETLELHVRQNRVWGVLTGGSFGDVTLTLDGARNRFKDRGDAGAQAVLSACTGYYTVSLPVSDLVSQGGSEAAPCGASYLTIRIASAGSAKLAGVLADGTSFSSASSVILFGDDGWVCVPLACPLYAKAGWVGGLLWIDPDSRAVVTDSDHGWGVRWEQSKGTPLDFDELLGTFGGYYEKPSELEPAYRFSAGLDKVPYPSPAGFVDPVSEAFPLDVAVVGSGAKLSMENGTSPYRSSGEYVYEGGNSSMAKLSFSSSTGIFKGSFCVYYDYEENGRLRHRRVSVPYSGILIVGGNRDSETSVEALPSFSMFSGTVGLGHCLVPDSDPAVKAYGLKRSFMVGLYPLLDK